jgi:Protein of unknown function (DUF559)
MSENETKHREVLCSGNAVILGTPNACVFAPTDAEAALWRNLRAGRLADHKFKRQQPIGNYIVDFVCFQRKLVVEVDGGQHVEA